MRRGARQLGMIMTLSLLAPEIVSAQMASTHDWWGSLGYAYQNRMIDNQTVETRNQLVGEVYGKYYLWQPWFINGNMGLTYTTDSSDNGVTTRETTSLGGSLSANVVPQSNYPLSLGFKKNDYTVNDVADIDGTTSTTSYYATQSYIGKRFKLTASWNEDEVETVDSGVFSTIKEKLVFTSRVPHNDIAFSLQHIVSEQSASDEDRDSKSATLSHNYYPSQEFSVANHVSRVEQLDHIDLDNDTIVDKYINEIDQVSSTALWRSSNKKTHVNGNLRYTGVLTAGPVNTYENLNANIGMGVRHRFNDNLYASASVSHIESELNGVPSAQDIYNTSLAYDSDSIDLSGFAYSWGSSIAYSQQETDDTSQSTAAVSLNHNATRNWRYGRRGHIRFNMNQGLGSSKTTSQDPKQTLSQSVQLGYRGSATAGSQYAQARYSESRAISGGEELTQQLNMQYSRQYKVNTRSSLNGSLTFQKTGYENATQNTQSNGGTALVNYSWRNNFAFQTLSFNSSFSYSILNSNVAEDSGKYSWDNALKHQIGQLFSTLTVRIQQEQAKKQTALIILNVKRKF